MKSFYLLLLLHGLDAPIKFDKNGNYLVGASRGIPKLEIVYFQFGLCQIDVTRAVLWDRTYIIY